MAFPSLKLSRVVSGSTQEVSVLPVKLHGAHQAAKASGSGPGNFCTLSGGWQPARAPFCHLTALTPNSVSATFPIEVREAWGSFQTLLTVPGGSSLLPCRAVQNIPGNLVPRDTVDSLGS